MTTKYRVLKTEGGRKVFKALEECTKKGTQTLDISGRDE